jgi:hypothetical protein
MYAVPNALLLFPTFFHISPTFMVNFATFPATSLTFEAQNKVWISYVFPLLLLPDLQFHQLFVSNFTNFFSSKI